MAMSRVLVIGASGFIGHACVVKLADSGHEVAGVGRRFPGSLATLWYEARSLNFDDLQKLVGNFKPDVCLNAAGSGSPAASVNNPSVDFEANTLLAQRILEALRTEAPRCRYIGISSAAVYGDNPELPWAEGARLRPRSPYGYHKVCAELLAEEYHRVYGLGTLMLRAFSVYGPGLRKQLFWDIFQRSRHVSELSLFGTGRETRDYIYVDDLAAGVAQLAERAEFAGESLNLASGQATSIADACQILLDELAWKGTHGFTGNEIPGSPLRMEAEMTRAFALGFRPRVDLTEGLRRTAMWLMKTHGNV